MRTLLFAAVLTMFGGAVAAWANQLTVSQANTSFSIESLTVKPGDTVVFENKDSKTHNIQIVSADGSVDDKGLQKPGQDVKATLNAAGEYKVRCAIHPKMKMVITVK
ncbi:MAG TPA: plastocyanin/azurin family copper-binding protein [Nitrospiria bacterium]|nr:plastocyanin/azurin family copper-binding protein [Nitrospiria bacterium]